MEKIKRTMPDIESPGIETCNTSLLRSPLDESGARALAHSFAALSDPTRLRLFGMIANAEAGEVCACDFVESLGKSQPTVSHHLKVLAEAGLVVAEKRGRWVWYSVVTERLDSLLDALNLTKSSAQHQRST